MKSKNYLVMLLVVLCAVACSDDVKNTPTTVGDTMTIDASSYADWVYVNLATGETQTVNDYSRWFYAGSKTYADAKASASDIKIDWHIAFHRYDVRTNGASAVLTTATTLAEVADLGLYCRYGHCRRQPKCRRQWSDY